MLISSQHIDDQLSGDPSVFEPGCVDNLGVVDRPVPDVEDPSAPVPKKRRKKAAPAPKEQPARRVSGDRVDPVVPPASLPAELGPNEMSDGMYGRLTIGQVYRLQLHLRQVGLELKPVRGDGNCLFNAVRRGLVLGTSYYKSQHLRRQLVQYCLDNQYSVLQPMQHDLADLYGDGTHFWPVNFVEYLRYLSLDGSWGDQIVLYLIARMWNLRISVVYAGGGAVDAPVWEVPFRHAGSLEDADLVLVFDGFGHYSAAVPADGTGVECEKVSWKEGDTHFSTEVELLADDEDERSPDPTLALAGWDQYQQHRARVRVRRPDVAAAVQAEAQRLSQQMQDAWVQEFQRGAVETKEREAREIARERAVLEAERVKLERLRDEMMTQGGRQPAPVPAVDVPEAERVEEVSAPESSDSGPLDVQRSGAVYGVPAPPASSVRIVQPGITAEYLKESLKEMQANMVAHLKEQMTDLFKAGSEGSGPVATEASLERGRQDRGRYEGEPAKTCPECGKSYAFAWEVDRHVYEEHPDLRRSFRCPVCGAGFRSHRNLEAHSNTHLSEEERHHFKCAICGKFFLSKAAVKRHCLSHQAPGAFPCERCAAENRHAVFDSRSALHRHTNLEHTVLTAEELTCSACGKSGYKNKATLRQHQRACPTSSHYEGPFLCRWCKASFVAKRDCLYHERNRCKQRPG